MTIPVSVSIASNIEKSGNLIHNYNNTSVIAAGQNATDGSEVYIKTENSAATSYTKGADRKFVATSSAPMTPAGQAWGATDFTSLNLLTKQNGYVVTGKGIVTYLQITMTISGYGSTTISLPQELQ